MPEQTGRYAVHPHIDGTEKIGRKELADLGKNWEQPSDEARELKAKAEQLADRHADGLRAAIIREAAKAEAYKPIAMKPPTATILPPWVRYEPLLLPEQCADLIRLGEEIGLEPATIGNGRDDEFVLDTSYRAVQACRIPHIGAADIYRRIRERVEWTNDDHFRFDLSGLYEPIQLLRYDASLDQPGHYDWHQDFGGELCSLRKLSVVIQLSDPSEYDGCELEVMAPKPIVASKGIGDAVIFPTWSPHRVTEITRGCRYAAVLWVGGPPFR